MKTAERERQYPEIFLHRALASSFAANGWQVREEVSYLTKRFDIVAFRDGIVVCVEVKTRDAKKAIRQLATSRMIFHQVFVAVAERYATGSTIDACLRTSCGLISIGAPPQFLANVLVSAPWCQERVDSHTTQLLRITGFRA